MLDPRPVRRVDHAVADTLVVEIVRRQTARIHRVEADLEIDEVVQIHVAVVVGGVVEHDARRVAKVAAGGVVQRLDDRAVGVAGAGDRVVAVQQVVGELARSAAGLGVRGDALVDVLRPVDVVADERPNSGRGGPLCGPSRVKGE